jgi:hypothetical protein
MVLIRQNAPKPDGCRYYEGGYCQNGDGCKFWHDPAIASIPCKHFLAGNCRNGEKCAYMHGDEAKAAADESEDERESRCRSCVAPEAPADAEVCRYDPNCYRVNPDHLRKFRHPSRDALPPPRKTATPESSAYDWSLLRRTLPTDRTPTAAAARKQLFKSMDYNGNGMISLAEVDKCVIENLGLGDVFPKKVMLRAFYAANQVAPKNGTLTDDMVTFSEFRVLLCALRRYLQCFEVFDVVDSAVERDGRIDTAEVQRSESLLKAYGLPEVGFDRMMQSTQRPPMETMACAVAAKNHMILFQEFCSDFALRYNLNCDPTDGFGQMFHGARPVKRWGEY